MSPRVTLDSGPSGVGAGWAAATPEPSSQVMRTACWSVMPGKAQSDGKPGQGWLSLPTMPSHRRLLVTVFALACAAPLGASRDAATARHGPEPAQGREFTAEDMLKISTASVLDLSDDGRRVAVSVRRAYDNAEVDNRRFGDPTYLSPSQVKLLVIDTQTGRPTPRSRSW